MTISVKDGFELIGDDMRGCVVFHRKSRIVFGYFAVLGIPYRLYWEILKTESEYSFVCEMFEGLNLRALLSYFKQKERVNI